MSGMPSIPLQPVDENGPVFAQPWQAQAFALVLKLHQEGCFEWQEWTQMLGAEISAAGKRGDADLGDEYYLYWLTALERMVESKGLVSWQQLADRKHEWQHAVANTPHGQPIKLRES